MGIFRFARKVHTSLKFLTIHSRAYCDPRSPPKTCFILGKYGPVALSGHQWCECEEYIENYPLVSPIVPHRLILKIDPRKPYIFNDLSRGLIQSGLYLPFFADQRGESYAGSFRKENMGVLKELNMFAFRELKQDTEGRWRLNRSAGFNEYGFFLEEFLQSALNTDNSSTILPPDDISMFLACLKSAIVNVTAAMDHPSTYTDQTYSAIMVELYRLLKEQLPLIGESKLVSNILIEVGQGTATDNLSTFQSHAFLNAFLPEDLKNSIFVQPKEGSVSDAKKRKFTPLLGGPFGWTARNLKTGDGFPGSHGIGADAWNVKAHDAVLGSDGGFSQRSAGIVVIAVRP